MSDFQQIAELMGRLQKQQTSEADAKLKAFEGLLNDVSLALGNVVELMEAEAKGEKAERAEAAAAVDLSELVEAIRDMRPPEVSVAAPEVSVNVAAPNVSVTPQINNVVNVPEAPAPVIHLMNQGKSVHKVEIKYDIHRLPESMTITRIN